MAHPADGSGATRRAALQWVAGLAVGQHLRWADFGGLLQAFAQRLAEIGHGGEIVAAPRVQPLQQLVGAKRLLAELRTQADQTGAIQVQQVGFEQGCVQAVQGQRERGQICSALKK